MINRQKKMGLISLRDETLQLFKEIWGVGKNRTEQARRLIDGNINLEVDRDAIIGMAMLVNAELALNEIELKELEKS